MKQGCEMMTSGQIEVVYGIHYPKFIRRTQILGLGEIYETFDSMMGQIIVVIYEGYPSEQFYTSDLSRHLEVGPHEHFQWLLMHLILNGIRRGLGECPLLMIERLMGLKLLPRCSWLKRTR